MTDSACLEGRGLELWRGDKRLFRDLWSNDDAFKYSMSRKVLDGKFQWMESGLVSTERKVRPRPQKVTKVS